MKWALAMDEQLFSGMRWYEIPLLLYFMLHYFPPGPPALVNACLVLAVGGVLWDCRRRYGEIIARFRQPLFWSWLALVAVLGISILQSPPALQAESWHRYGSEIGKGGLFGMLLVLYLDNEGKAKRLLWAGMIAALVICSHALVSVVREVLATGEMPRPRDYLYWLVGFFPFALGGYVSLPRWRWPAALSVVCIFALAVMTSFRGAILALCIMGILYLMVARLWRLLIAGVGLAATTLPLLVLFFPGRAEQVLTQLSKIDSSARLASHWVPAWQLSLESPWLGHGYSQKIFGQLVHDGVSAHPDWLPRGLSSVDWFPSAPHNVFLEVLFIAGFPGGVLLFIIIVAMLAALIIPLWRLHHQIVDKPIPALMFAVFVAFVGNFMILAQTEMAAWRTLGALVGITLACRRLLQTTRESGVGKEAQAS